MTTLARIVPYFRNRRARSLRVREAEAATQIAAEEIYLSGRQDERALIEASLDKGTLVLLRAYFDSGRDTERKLAALPS